MVKCDFAKLAMDVRRISPRIFSVDMVLCGKAVTNISAHKPHSGLSEIDKRTFCADLGAEVQSKNCNCFVLGDFNGPVGSSIDGYIGVH